MFNAYQSAPEVLLMLVDWEGKTHVHKTHIPNSTYIFHIQTKASRKNAQNGL